MGREISYRSAGGDPGLEPRRGVDRVAAMASDGADIRAQAAELRRVSLVPANALSDGAASLTRMAESLGRNERLVSLTQGYKENDADGLSPTHGFLVATSQRLIFTELSGSSALDQMAVPLDQIEMLSVRARWADSDLHLHVSAREIVFTSVKEAQVFADRLQKAMAEAEKLRLEPQVSPTSAPWSAASGAAVVGEDVTVQLERLGSLREKGVITETEFKDLKARLLGL